MTSAEQLGAHASAEGGRDAVGQLGEAPGLPAARVPLAEQFGQQGAVHVGPPGQARAVHLGGDEEGRGLGGGEQPHPVGVGGGRESFRLVGVDGEEGVQGEGVGCGSKRESWARGSAARGRGSGGTGALVSRAQAAAAERGSPKRPSWPRSSSSASSMSWHRSTRAAGREQAGVHGGGGPPDPAGAGWGGADRVGGVADAEPDAARGGYGVACHQPSASSARAQRGVRSLMGASVPPGSDRGGPPGRADGAPLRGLRPGARASNAAWGWRRCGGAGGGAVG